MAGIDTENEKNNVAALRLLQNRILLPYEAEAMRALQYLEMNTNAWPTGPRKTLINRWKQIRDILQQVLGSTDLEYDQMIKTPAK